MYIVYYTYREVHKILLNTESVVSGCHDIKSDSSTPTETAKELLIVIPEASHNHLHHNSHIFFSSMQNAKFYAPQSKIATSILVPVPTIICGHPSIFPPPSTKKKWVCKLCFQHCGGVRGARLGISSTSVSSANNCRDR